MSRSRSLAACLALSATLAPLVASAQLSPADAARRTRLTAQVARRASAVDLCQLGELDRLAGAHADATTHLERGISLATRAPRRPPGLLPRCYHSLAQSFEARGDLTMARHHAESEFQAATGAARDAARAFAIDLTRRLRSGERCAEGLDAAGLRAAELDVLALLATGDAPPLRQCLAAVRRRANAPSAVCAARASNTPPLPVSADAGSSEWVMADAQTGVFPVDTEHLVVGRASGGATRYLDCAINSGIDTVVPTASWIGTGNARLLAVRYDENYRSEEGNGPLMATRWVMFFDESLALVGSLALDASDEGAAGAASVPFRDAEGVEPRFEGGAVMIGSHRLTLRDGALVGAP